MGHGTTVVEHFEFQLVDQRNQGSNPGGECTNLCVETWAMSFSPRCLCLFEDIIHTQPNHRSQGEDSWRSHVGSAYGDVMGVLLRFVSWLQTGLHAFRSNNSRSNNCP